MILPSLHTLNQNKMSSYWYRRRRHSEWTDNYTLYRDKVQLNRLTQRQSVNVPLIKYSIKTLLKDIDDPPMMYFVNLDNDEQAEVYYNEYWNVASNYTKTTIKDIVDKRQVLLFGRSFKHLNLMNGRFYWEVKDPQDIGLDRYVDPADIDTARHMEIEHNYLPLASLTTNPRWNTAEVKKLQNYYKSGEGLHHAGDNMMDYVEKQARMFSMGVVDQMNPILGETYVELVEHFTKVYDTLLQKDRYIYSVIADDMAVLFQAPLDVVIGQTADDYWQDHLPMTTWGDETERTDFWSDGVADTLRTLNKIMNAWFSQMVENRTLRNFGMTFYNSSMAEEGFQPQTYAPEPFGFYPIPAGNKALGDQMMHVDIPDIGNDTIQELEFIKMIAEQASAATTFQQGEQAPQEMTLGEVKLLLANAQERVKSMAVYYTDSWKEFGHKYIKLLEAAPHLIDATTVHKKGRLTKRMYSKHISPEDWMTKTGFQVEVKMKAEKIEDDMNALQWLNAGRTVMIGNPIVDEEYKQKLLENSGMSAEKIVEALKYDKQMQEDAAQQMQQQQMLGQQGQPGTPTQQGTQPQQAQLGSGQPQQQQPAQLPPVIPQTGAPAQ